MKINLFKFEYSQVSDVIDGYVYFIVVINM